MAEALLFDGRRASLAALDRARLQVMWREHVAGSRDHSVFVWAVMMLALWEDAAAGQTATVR